MPDAKEKATREAEEKAAEEIRAKERLEKRKLSYKVKSKLGLKVRRKSTGGRASNRAGALMLWFVLFPSLQQLTKDDKYTQLKEVMQSQQDVLQQADIADAGSEVSLPLTQLLEACTHHHQTRVQVDDATSPLGSGRRGSRRSSRGSRRSSRLSGRSSMDMSMDTQYAVARHMKSQVLPCKVVGLAWEACKWGKDLTIGALRQQLASRTWL